MTLNKQFKTNSVAANDGVWFDFPDAPNEDGSVPGFCMSRKATQNKAYSQAMRDFIQNTTDAEGLTKELTHDENASLDLDIFLAALLQDWRNFQPEDDGKSIDYSYDNAKAIFGDPDWSDLYKDLVIKCSQSAAYRTARVKAEAKN